MKDTVAEAVAKQVQDLIVTLEGMGLRRPSIIAGLELGVQQARGGEATRPRASGRNSQRPTITRRR